MHRGPDLTGAAPPRPDASPWPSRAPRPSPFPGRAAREGKRRHAGREARPMAVRDAAGRARHCRTPSPPSPRTRRGRAIRGWAATHGGPRSAEVPAAGSEGLGRELTSGRGDTGPQETGVAYALAAAAAADAAPRCGARRKRTLGTVKEVRIGPACGAAPARPENM